MSARTSHNDDFNHAHPGCRLLLLPVSADEAAEVYRHPFAYADRLQPRTENGESLEENVSADSVA